MRNNRRWFRISLTLLALPLIFAVVERVRLHHMVGGIERGLQPEQVTRIAQMRAQVGRHRAERLEDRAEDRRVRSHHRVVWIREMAVLRQAIAFRLERGIPERVHCVVSGR